MHIIVKQQNSLLSFCLLVGSLFMCFSCSSSDDENPNEEIWTSADRAIIDKYKDYRMLMGTVWGWRKSLHEYDGQHSVRLYADRTCQYTWTVGTTGFVKEEGVWEYDPETNRLITTTNFPKLTLKIFSPRDMSGYTDDGKLINVTLSMFSSIDNKFRNDNTTFDFLVGKWKNKSTGNILIIHANGEYEIKNQNMVYAGIIDKWSDVVGRGHNYEPLLLKENKALGIRLLSGSLIEVQYYLTNIHIEEGELSYNEIEGISGSYEYMNVDL